VDTTITPELRAEGLAREIVRRVQEMRKAAGFEIADRISTYYSASDQIAAVMVNFGGYIQAETLSLELVSSLPPAEAYWEEQKIDNASLILGIRR
jgi:isoleucyl-tRNA synthetase